MSPCQVASAAMWLCLSPHKSQPHTRSPFPSQSPQLCVTVLTACHKEPQHEAGVPPSASPPPACAPLSLPAGETEAVGQEAACPRYPVPGLGRANRILGTGWQCLQAMLALCWECGFAAVFHPSSGSLGTVPLSPQVTPPHLGAGEGGNCSTGVASAQRCVWQGWHGEQLGLGPLPVAMPFSRGSCLWAWLGSCPCCGLGRGRTPLPWATGSPLCRVATRGATAVMALQFSAPLGFLCQKAEEGMSKEPVLPQSAKKSLWRGAQWRHPL